MSGETLQRAAALMRERAQAATGADYHWRTGKASKPGRGLVACGKVQIAFTDERIGEGDHNAEHIASWHPGVALAVADLLDEAAASIDQAEADGVSWARVDSIHHAFAVANTYLAGAAVTP